MVKNLHYLSGEIEEFRNGYIIIEDTLFNLNNRVVEDEWDLSSETLEDKVIEARKEAELSDEVPIYYDDIEAYNEDTVSDEGELITIFQAFNRMSQEEQDDEESLIEHYM